MQQLHSALLDEKAVRLYIKRDDLIHPHFGGNKWRKLKYNLIHASENDFDTLLTFGGAWSNHIYATAAAGQYFGFNTIGLIRGEPHAPSNPCLSFASKCGMQLHYLDRVQYRQKHEAGFLRDIKQRFGRVYILPEGGSNTLALKGCTEIVEEVSSELDEAFDIICCASGTGATLAGLALSLDTKNHQHRQKAIGFSVLKAGEFLTRDVKRYLADADSTNDDWHIETQFHFGGYAKINEDLTHFMQTFQSRYKIALDAVYTAKMFYGLFEMIKSDAFDPGSNIVAIHSGGLQGNAGFNL